MKNILVCGYPSLDRIIKVDKELKVGETSLVTNKNSGSIYYGGCSVNISSILSRLGLISMPIIRVGDDFEKTKYKSFLLKHNVDLKGVKEIKGEKTSCSYLIELKNGDHITLFSPGAMSQDYFEGYDEQLFENAKVVIMTINSMKDNLEIIKLAKKYDLDIILGMKLDRSGFTNDVIRDVMNQTKIIFANKEEAKELKNLFGFNNIKEFFKFERLDSFVVTRGKKGSTIYTRKNTIKIDTVEGKKIVDTTGAGDAYLSGFIFGYLNNRCYETCGRYGSVLSSFIIEKMGCTTNIPTYDKFHKRYLKLYGVEK